MISAKIYTNWKARIPQWASWFTCRQAILLPLHQSSSCYSSVCAFYCRKGLLHPYLDRLHLLTVWLPFSLGDERMIVYQFTDLIIDQIRNLTYTFLSLPVILWNPRRHLTVECCKKQIVQGNGLKKPPNFRACQQKLPG